MLVDANEKWAAAIGRAFVAFGGIEHVSVLCLHGIPRDRIQRSTRGFKLTQRIDLILELVEGRSEAPFWKLSELLLKAKDLARTRNLIAHNPLVLDIYEHPDGDIQIKQNIVSLHKEDHSISLPELEDFAAESQRLATALYACATEVFAALPSNHEP